MTTHSQSKSIWPSSQTLFFSGEQISQASRTQNQYANVAVSQCYHLLKKRPRVGDFQNDPTPGPNLFINTTGTRKTLLSLRGSVSNDVC